MTHRTGGHSGTHLKAAKSLGLIIPNHLLALADEVVCGLRPAAAPNVSPGRVMRTRLNCAVSAGAVASRYQPADRLAALGYGGEIGRGIAHSTNNPGVARA